MHQIKEVLARAISDLKIVRKLAQCGKSATVEEATKLLQASEGGSLVVLDEKKVVGIFTERDVLKKVTLTGIDPKTPITKLMTPNPVTVKRSTTVGEALKKMREGKFRHLVVVDAYGVAESMLSMRDILDHLAGFIVEDVK